MGRPDFTTPGTDGSGQTLAVNERPELRQITEDRTTQIASGGTEVIDVFAPPASVYSVRGLYLQAESVSGTATGDHEWFVQTSPTTRGPVRILRGTSSPSQELRYDYGSWQTADQQQLPSTEQTQESIVQRMRATEDVPIRFIYSNNTDESTAAKRTIILYVDEVTF